MRTRHGCEDAKNRRIAAADRHDGDCGVDSGGDYPEQQQMVALEQRKVKARAAAILASRQSRRPGNNGLGRWWIVGLVMCGLGLATGVGGWWLALTLGVEVMPTLLP